MRVVFSSFIILISLLNNSYAYWTANNSNQQARSSFLPASFSLDVDQFKTALYQLNNNNEITINLPRANGELDQYKIHRVSVMAPELALKHPEIQTFAITGITHPSDYGRMELLNNVLSASIQTASGEQLITYSKELSARGAATYLVQSKNALPRKSFACAVSMKKNVSANFATRPVLRRHARPAVGSLKRLRVAIATTVEYSALFGNTKSSVLAEIAKAVNRVNGIYESELGLTLELVANNENIIFIGSDNFDNDNANTLINQSQTQIDSLIGSSNYDLGHVFSTGAGGLASVGSVCSASQKAQGVTGSTNPTGDAYWVDYVAHEMGHQVGADHTFNGTTGSCAGSSRTAAQAYEPGSGSTIMAYAGICGAENLQTNSDATFHTASIDQIDATFQGLSNCGQTISYSTIHSGVTNNANPTVDAGSDYTIPSSTPFMLTASASDSDLDTIYYQWDNRDLGTATNSTTFGTDLGNNPLFKTNLPFTQSTRFFPSLKTLLSGSADKGETLPTTSRDIKFRVKVTDGKNGVATDEATIKSVKPSSGTEGFSVTSQATSVLLPVNTGVNITWEIANSVGGVVNCPTVEVQRLNISADDNNYCTETLATGLLNNGSALLTMSATNSAKSRFLVKCENNVFFNINDADFTVFGGATNAQTSCLSTKGGVSIDTAAIYNTGLSNSNSSSSSTSSGGGIFNIPMLIGFSLLLLARRRV